VERAHPAARDLAARGPPSAGPRCREEGEARPWAEFSAAADSSGRADGARKAGPIPRGARSERQRGRPLSSDGILGQRYDRALSWRSNAKLRRPGPISWAKNDDNQPVREPRSLMDRLCTKSRRRGRPLFRAIHLST